MSTTEDYFDLGAYSWSITPSCKAAQIWFDRGLAWVYGYNHEEAIVCFERAVQADPNCAMAYWGIAYAAGPNYNRWWFTFTPQERKAALSQAHDALSRARSGKDKVSAQERALIDALITRYPRDAET